MKGDLMSPLGRHILLEAYGCNVDLLEDVDSVEQIMTGAALAAGAEVREVTFHQFSPQGVSGVVVIAESHLTIHTWPEFGYAAIDVFTCGESVNPWDAVDYLADNFEADTITSNEIKRGVFQTNLND